MSDLTDKQVVQCLRRGEFESRESLLKSVYYHAERALGQALFRRPPPRADAPRLLNLGCGPLCYPGWVNADEFAFKRSLRESQFRPDWRLDVSRPWNCPDNYWDGIFTQHVIEHLHYSSAIFALDECYRTLRPGAWLRVSVPAIERTLSYYRDGGDDPFYRQFPRRGLALAFLTQMHFHKSAWDVELMSTVLRGLGYEQVQDVAAGQGTDPRLAGKDQESKAVESLYVEARKPTSAANR